MTNITDLIGMRPISADSHIMEPPDCYSSRIEAKYRDVSPHVIYDEKRGDCFVVPGMTGGFKQFGIAGICSAGRPAAMDGMRFDDIHRGAWDPKARLLDMDRDSVVAELIFPSAGMVVISHPDPDYAQACLWAYNRWLQEYCSGAPDRLFGIGVSAAPSPKQLLEDIKAFKAMGFRGAMLPDAPVEEDYDSPLYDPVWECAADMGMPICFHILAASPRGPSPLDGKTRGGRLNGFVNIIRATQDVMGLFIFTGVFDRHPKLRLLCVEADGGWAAHWMHRADHGYDRHHSWLVGKPLEKKPSEYFGANVSLTFQDDLSAFKIAHLLPKGTLLWASDYPHSDSTWPHSMQTVLEQSQGVSPELLKSIVHDNSRALFGLENL